MLQKGQSAHGQQGYDRTLSRVPPAAQQAPHHRRVRSSCRCVEATRVLPGHRPIDPQQDAHQDEVDVKIFVGRRIEGVQLGLSGKVTRQCLDDLPPVEHEQQRRNDDQIEDLRDHAFKAISYH